MAEFTNQSLKFHSDALPDNTLLVNRLTGEEQMSGLFRFTLDLISTDPKIDLQKVLYQPAKVGIEQRLGGGMKTFRWFHGTLELFQQSEQGQSWTTYRAVLVPDMWKLTEFFRSRVFQQKTVDELVAHVLKQDIGLQDGTDFEFKLTRAEGDRKDRAVYPEREYIVQYEETDLNLVHRWLEHEGVFYFFENDGTAEKVVFADSVSAYAPVNKGRSSAYPYRPQGRSQSTGATQGDEAPPEEVLAFEVTLTRTPKKVALNDYNWRDPSVQLAIQSDVDSDGIGKQMEYNDHFKTQDQGKALADVRAQEWTCRASVFNGTSTCRSFRPGKTFDLEQHFRDDFNRNFLLVAVVHEAEQAINLEASTVTGASYQNSFQAIPSDLDFRPACETDWPCIKGTMHARVDAEGDGEFAELDEHGRYKLIFPFDEEAPNAEPGKASRWVRMAQPYAGANSGFHFPLLMGTEVLVTHIDGDPDRPIIAAAVPNPEAHSPVDSGNNKQNKVSTTNGNMMILDDSEELQGFVFADGNGTLIQDFRHAGAGGGGGGGGGGELGPGRGGEGRSLLLPEDMPESLKKAIRGSRLVPPELARQLRLRAGKGAVEADDRKEDFGASDAQTEVQAYLATNLDTSYVQPGLDAVTVAEGESPAAPIDQDHRFEVKHFDNWLRFWKGDITMILQGNRWTYADVTHDVKFGTGGYGYAREDGDTTDYSVQNGNAVSYSTHNGNSTSESTTNGDSTSTSTTTGNDTSTSTTTGDSSSTSTTVGDSTSMSTTCGDDDSTSITIGDSTSASLALSDSDSLSLAMGQHSDTSLSLSTHDDFSLTLSDSSSLSIALSISDETSITLSSKTSLDLVATIEDNKAVKLGLVSDMNFVLGAFSSIDLFIGGKSNINIVAALMSEINLLATGKFQLDLSASAILQIVLAGAGGLRLNLTPDGDKVIDIPKKLSLSMEDGHIAIKKGNTVLMKEDQGALVKQGA